MGVTSFPFTSELCFIAFWYVSARKDGKLSAKFRHVPGFDSGFGVFPRCFPLPEPTHLPEWGWGWSHPLPVSRGGWVPRRPRMSLWRPGTARTKAVPQWKGRPVWQELGVPARRGGEDPKQMCPRPAAEWGPLGGPVCGSPLPLTSPPGGGALPHEVVALLNWEDRRGDPLPSASETGGTSVDVALQLTRVPGFRGMHLGCVG